MKAKIIKEEPVFRPIQLILETPEELTALRALAHWATTVNDVTNKKNETHPEFANAKISRFLHSAWVVTSPDNLGE